MKVLTAFFTIGLGCLLSLSCETKDIASEPSEAETTTTGTTTPNNDNSVLPTGFNQFGSNVEVYQDGNFMVIVSTGIPDHKSPYFSSADSRYEAYNGSNQNFRAAPNTIATSNVTYRIPLNPAKAANSSATPLGPIGVSVNGIPFYNQYAAGRSPLTNEVNGFDQYGGHPQQQGQYHYHVEPIYITKNKGQDALLGYLLDGFPVYGPEESGKTVSNNNLDAYHGHSHTTSEYPSGIYHYHITDADPYINGSGFYGTAGTVSR